MENEERHIFIGYRITERLYPHGTYVEEGYPCRTVPAIDVTDTEALAFDHAYILNAALDRLEEMQKEYREAAGIRMQRKPGNQRIILWFPGFL